MMKILVDLVFGMIMIAGGVLTLYGLYFCAVALVGLKKRPGAPAAAPATRFAVLIAARNEEAVIGNLVDSLKAQNYPQDKVDIYVAPNNCTDGTEAAARAHGAIIFTPEGKITCKGQVLAQAGQQLLADDKYDAVCVFDADNLVHPDFLQRMNDARLAGAQVAQGFRDSKNPSDSAISTCYSVCYWMLNRFYNGGRQAMGLSGLVNGSGFMVSTRLLRAIGGFNTQTMTEDYEFSAQCVLHGERVHYVADAIIYDEQPLTFFQSWKQRRRWSTGSAQGMEIYSAELLRAGFTRRSWRCIDLALTFITPAVQLASVVMGVCTLLQLAYQVIGLHLMPIATALGLLVLAVLAAFALCTALAAFVVWMNRGRLQGTGRGIACFALFLLTWMPIGIISLFKRQTKWDAIAHTKAVGLAELGLSR